MKTISSTAIVLIIASAVSTFRRAGEGFTDKGTAFPSAYFTDEQLDAINKEPKLSVKSVPANAIPEGVDSSLVQAAFEAGELEAADEGAQSSAKEKTPAKAKADKTAPAK